MTLPSAPPSATQRKLAALMRYRPPAASPRVATLADQPTDRRRPPPSTTAADLNRTRPIRPTPRPRPNIPLIARAARPGNRGGSALRRAHDFPAWAAGDTGYNNAAYDHVCYARRAWSGGWACRAPGQAD